MLRADRRRPSHRSLLASLLGCVTRMLCQAEHCLGRAAGIRISDPRHSMGLRRPNHRNAGADRWRDAVFAREPPRKLRRGASSGYEPPRGHGGDECAGCALLSERSANLVLRVRSGDVAAKWLSCGRRRREVVAAKPPRTRVAQALRARVVVRPTGGRSAFSGVGATRCPTRPVARDGAGSLGRRRRGVGPRLADVCARGIGCSGCLTGHRVGAGPPC